LVAATLTAGMTIAITVYAATTKNDFTVFGPVLFVVGFVFAITSIFAFAFGPTGNLIFSAFGVILFSFFLAYDTQLIMGGKMLGNKPRKTVLQVDQYVLGAVSLYLDIINIFLYLL
jgi:FtsH-binding integral membrane protein